MVRCARCWLHKSMRVVNLLVNVCGVAMIIYSLWLLKKWQLEVSELPYHLSFPKPWFAHSCLGVGIIVCMSSLFAHIVVNSNTGTALICIYIVVLCLLLSLEIAIIVTIFFKINWILQLSKYIDEHNTEFESFVIFNFSICRLIVFIALVPQIYEIALAMILWGIRTETSHTHMNIPDFRQSFLVGPNSPVIHVISGHSFGCTNILLNNSHTQSPPQNFIPYIIGIFRARFPSRARQIVY